MLSAKILYSLATLTAPAHGLPVSQDLIHQEQKKQILITTIISLKQPPPLLTGITLILSDMFF